MQLKNDISRVKPEDRWREKYHASLTDLNLKEKQWQDTEQLLRLLVSRLTMLVDCQDQVLNKKLQKLRKSFREGGDVLSLERQIKEISEQILALEDGVPSAQGPNTNNNLQIVLLGEILLDLLERVNFPAQFSTQIDNIKSSLIAPGAALNHQDLVKGVASLEEVLKDVFQSYRQDKKSIERYLQQLSGELQTIDEGINASQSLTSAKQQAEENINSMVESEVLEMENSMTLVIDLESLKGSVQERLAAIRIHMDNFKAQESERNLEALRLAAHLGKQLSRMEQECTLLKQQVLEKHEQTLSDVLTGIRNRLAYEEYIKTEIDRFKRYGRPVSLLVLDLDNFKHVNDTHGHSVGDKALRFIANVLAKNIRSVDFLARYGGEEFVVILPELTITEARKTAEKICKAVQASKFVFKDIDIEMTISGGAAEIHKDDTAETFFERADNALYVAKERGRNRIETE